MKDALALEESGDLIGANEIYKRILTNHPNDLEALRGLAVNLTLGGDYNSALPYQEKVVALDSKDAQTRIELGFNYYNHQGEAERGLLSMREAATIEPSARNRTFVAQLCWWTGRKAEAVDILEAVLVKDPVYEHANILIKQYNGE